MKWRLSHFSILPAALLTSSFLVAFDASRADELPKHGGTAIFAIGSDPARINRNVSSNNPDGVVACMIYEGLTRIVADGDVKPLLAKSWTESDDGLVYTFDLNKAQWSDGEPFTSDDVKFTLLDVSAKYSAMFADPGRAIDTIETPTPERVVIRLKEPFGPLLRSLACNQGGALLPAHILRGTDILTNPLMSTAPLGTGPFMLEEWKRGNYVRLAANPHYWQPGKPYLNEVIAQILPQASSRTQALLSGEVDIVPYYFMAPSDYQTVKANPVLRLTPGPITPSLDFIAFNVKRKPLDDKRVRQALMIATDRDLLLRTAYQNIGSPGTMPFTNRIPWIINPDVDYRKMYPFDPARANALLDEAGLKRGSDGTRFNMRFLYGTDGANDALVATAIKSMWSVVGVNVIIDAEDRTTYTKKAYKDYDTDATLVGFTTLGDPALGIARAFVSSSVGKDFGNAAGYSNPGVDKLFDQGRMAPTQDQRSVFYKELEAVLADELPVLTIHEAQYFNGTSVALHGLEDENALPSWRDAWLDR
jgi:peptide/nickel transport system substrate-binding protein